MSHRGDKNKNCICVSTFFIEIIRLHQSNNFCKKSIFLLEDIKLQKARMISPCPKDTPTNSRANSHTTHALDRRGSSQKPTAVN